MSYYAKPAICTLVLALGATGCDEQDTEPTAADASSLTDVRSGELPTLPSAPSGDCFAVGGKIRITPVRHSHHDTLIQEVGPIGIIPLGFGDNRFPGLSLRLGSILATVVGQQDDGAMLINHFMAFGPDTLRTELDPTTFTPTDDPCVLDLESQMLLVGGTGIFDGVTGEGHAVGSIDVCNGEVGHAVWAAQLCL